MGMTAAIQDMSTSNLNISLGFNFVGSPKPTNPKSGDIYLDLTSGCEYVYVDNKWECISSTNESTHAVKKTRCSTCGAILPVKDVDDTGLCECQYCKNIEYVWE